ncbi:unnamed protein product [Rhizoctonia solani]|uniref:Uncharacterized protein n=1 Tax=Rhizoctonia solani TaxID=456999 RepID=A0A8H3DG81_9AGAM|nr:unnamed protein product [Rhizoctonia solani]
MLKHFFHLAEREFIENRHENWRGVKGAKKEVIDGEVVCPKSQLVSSVVRELLEQFPERDHTKGPNGPLTWTQEERDSLWERTRQVFYNLDKAMAAKHEDNMTRGMKPSQAPSFNTLFKRHYNREIVALKDELLQRGSVQEPMAAYNTAVRDVLQRKKEEEPEIIQRLEDIVLQVKSNLRASPEEQPDDVRRAILDVLPADIISTVRGWERRTNARIYVMGIWGDCDGGLTKFDYASKGCGSYVKSAVGRKLFRDWIQYMIDNESDGITAKTEPKVAIYPDVDGWPTFPCTDLLKISQDDERMLLCRYFHLTSVASGGVTPMWTRIAREGNAGNSVRLECLPDGMTGLGNIKDWKRETMNKMRQHLIDGQEARLPPNLKFFWYHVPVREGSTPIILEVPLEQPVTGVTVPWTMAERRYGEWIARLRSPPTASGDNAGASLPPARTTHVYVPFNLATFEDLQDLHEDDTMFFQLILSTATIERLGPIHCSRGLAELCSRSNPHLPPAGQSNLIQNDSLNQWYGNEFFTTEVESRSEWSLMEFKHLLELPNVLNHAATGTVYTGPLGVRTVVLSLSRMKRNLDWLSKGVDVPPRLKWAIRSNQQQFDLPTAYRLWNDCVGIVEEENEASFIAANRTTTVLTDDGEDFVTQKTESDTEAELGLLEEKTKEIRLTEQQGSDRTLTGSPVNPDVSQAGEATPPDAAIQSNEGVEPVVSGVDFSSGQQSRGGRRRRLTEAPSRRSTRQAEHKGMAMVSRETRSKRGGK